MSRSVSAPSSVTKTSPCWNGLMVPGSTFRYGSNFWRVTLSPRLSSRQPRLAAAIPFPREETTPPVTKIYLAMCYRHFFEQTRHCLPILRRIDAQRFVLRFHDANLETVLERAQLFQALGAFERPDPEIGVTKQEIALIDVETDVFEMRRRLAARVGNRRSGKVESVT